MYVAKFVRNRGLLNAYLFEKVWNSEMQTHQITFITNKRFLFRFRAIHWLSREITRTLFEQHKLEIIDG